VTIARSPVGERPAPRLQHVRVRDVMHPGVVTCPAEASVREVARVMATHRIHCVAVPDPPGAGAGSWAIVSDRDLIAATATGDEGARSAAEIGTTETLTISDGDSVDRAVQLMAEREVAHLVVVAAASGRPVGVLSTLDVAGLLAGGEE
jgi:CBS domain-containing protein